MTRYQLHPPPPMFCFQVWPKDRPPDLSEFPKFHEYQGGIPKPIIRGKWTIPAVMWCDIVEVRAVGSA